MRLQQLQLILALAETGSLRAAALRLNVTQPALSKALRLLEEEFEAPLAVRTPKGVRLAPAGELLAARATIVLREIERAREEIAWQTHQAQARVSIGISPVAAAMLLPGALARLHARWPLVVVRVVDTLYPDAITLMRSGDLDIALGPLPANGAGSDLHIQALFESQLVLVVREGHPKADARKLAELVDSGWVITGPDHGPGDPRVLGFAKSGLVVPRPWVECESFSSLLVLIGKLDLIGIMPLGHFERYGANMGLLRLDIEDPMPSNTVHAIWRADTPLTVPTRSLLDALEQEAFAARAGKSAVSRDTGIVGNRSPSPGEA